jgi:hypothetical protein
VTDVGSVAIVWRGDRGVPDTATRQSVRLRRVFDALADVGVRAEAALYSDAYVDEVREQLLRVDGVLVWVDPIAGGEDRSKLDGLLREVASRGVWVSAHPDVIRRMGTKEVLYRTKSLGWGGDTHLYTSIADFRTRFPARLAEGRPRVVKQNRGNGGIGVWKVALVTATVTATAKVPGDDAVVRVQHAAPRDTITEELRLGTFIDRCEPYFAGSGRLIDQAFASRLSEGMVRAYLVRDEVVGFARQQPAVAPPDADVASPDRVFGLPSAKTMYDAANPEFDALKIRLEREWVPGLQRLVGVDDRELPLLWDADFLYGPRTAAGADSHILCEINVSSVSPFPDAAPRVLANAVHDRMMTA